MLLLAALLACGPDNTLVAQPAAGGAPTEEDTAALAAEGPPDSATDGAETGTGDSELVGTPGAGDLGVAGLMIDPASQPDKSAEWIELRDMTDASLDLQGLWLALANTGDERLILSAEGATIHTVGWDQDFVPTGACLGLDPAWTTAEGNPGTVNDPC